MKKIIAALITFFTLPLTYIGGYHIVYLANMNEDAGMFLGVFGGAILCFQAIVAAGLMLQGYKDFNGKHPFEGL